MSIQSSIENKLKRAFSPERLAVINESHLHAGHHHVEGGPGARLRRTVDVQIDDRIIVHVEAGVALTPAIDGYLALLDRLADPAP